MKTIFSFTLKTNEVEIGQEADVCGWYAGQARLGKGRILQTYKAEGLQKTAALSTIIERRVAADCLTAITDGSNRKIAESHKKGNQRFNKDERKD